MSKKDLKIALVHDFLLYPGGAEKVLKVLSEMFPEAPIYTLLHDSKKMHGMFRGKDIRTSYLQKFPRFLRRHHQWLLPFFSSAPETFDLRDFDLVISSSGAWTKGIVTKLDTIHIAYVHSPMRFAWDYRERYLSEDQKGKWGIGARLFFSYLRLWDKLASERPDHLIANSVYTQERIKKYYRRESTVIYPPVSLREQAHLRNVAGGSGQSNTKDYFLIVSRLSPYKKVDLAVETFNKLGLPLLVIGEGRQKKYLQKIAKSNVRILGWQSEEKLAEYYAGARAFIFPSDDDFGMTAVEAMGHGVPVIAYRKGGVAEIMQDEEAGQFFDAQTVEVLVDGVRRFMEREKEFDKDKIIQRASKFSQERFKEELMGFIEKAI
jgi:glycosyltransferase involved in cell wall biosynthesis